jgi:hypothetical protein
MPGVAANEESGKEHRHERRDALDVNSRATELRARLGAAAGGKAGREFSVEAAADALRATYVAALSLLTRVR